jgi:hypothetical protein
MTKVHRSLACRALLLTAALATLPGAKNGCGTKEFNETLMSPVQGVMTLVERADGTVEAELVIISTASSEHRYVDSAENVTLRTPSGVDIALERERHGHYRASSVTSHDLSYVPNETYSFQFELDDPDLAGDVAGGDFHGIMDPPGDHVSLEITRAPEFAGDTASISWEPAGRYAIVEVRNAETGQAAYSTFDFDQPHFDGSKWARLQTGGSLELGVDVFADAGTYTISLCAVDKVSDFDKSLSTELGALSGFLAGRCAAEQTVSVE